MSPRPLLVAVVAMVAAALGAGAALWLRDDATTTVIAPAVPPPAAPSAERPAFTLTDLEGRPRSVAEWDGRVLLINFWATWCPPCRREMPLFVALQEELGDQGLQVVAVAIDEVEAVRDFAAEHGINFPLLIGSDDAIRVSQAYGNTHGGLPYSVVVGRDGRVVTRHHGELTREQVMAALDGLL